ncbi:MAG TPA: septal ring lytic transglycosylase RlpA family protein [Bacteroidota bacterium]|jgi:rare lipoprotein A|nr:septal ring lytic transglycosylase RlpA family protein [Bacteroidota bacterium]
MTKIIKITFILIVLILKVASANNLQDEKKNNLGIASYYSMKHENKRTASGEKYKSSNLTAAHRTLPFGTLVKVTNLKNNKSVIVKINDRGPFVKGRILDLSYSAAKEIDMLMNGMAKVKIEVIDFAEK